MSTHRHVLVRGRVQGVGYRAWAERVALSRGLQGWVRNRRDGSVEAVLAGSDEAVDEMLSRLRSGPRGSRVDEVIIIGEGTASACGFEVRPTV